MPSHFAPGVLVAEISGLPQSIADVETALPAFIGYTERADVDGTVDMPQRSARISSLDQFEAAFGKGPRCPVREVELDDAGNFVGGVLGDTYTLYDSLRLFFENGGGDCYIFSVGAYRATEPLVDPGALREGLTAAAAVDAPTLLLFPDAAILGAGGLAMVHNAALRQCGDLQDRLAVLDMRRDDPLGVSFRAEIDTVNLGYGAAYTPWLRIESRRQVGYAEVRNVIKRRGAPASLRDFTADPEVVETLARLDRAIDNGALADVPPLELRLSESFAVYRNIIGGLGGLPGLCPPGGAIAGVYARVDRQHGVWKAPANVSLAGVIAPLVALDSRQCEALAGDDAAGKSINAIRSIPGKGVLVWGARTLAGNDNEWRYISVRRLVNQVEESIRKSTAWVAFEANDENTWIRVRAMIENHLIAKWRAGALAGTKPEEAFFVSCGLGKTMTALDIQEGRMIVEVGLAVARPAEFVILKFLYRLQGG